MIVKKHYYMTKNESHDMALFFMAFGARARTIFVNYISLCNIIVKRQLHMSQAISLLSLNKEYSLVSTVADSYGYSILTLDTSESACRAVSHILTTTPQLLYMRCTFPGKINNDVIRFASSLTSSQTAPGCEHMSSAEFLFYALNSPNDQLCATVQRHLFAYGVQLFSYPFFNKLPKLSDSNLAKNFYKDLVCEIDEKVPVVHPLFPVVQPLRARAERRVKVVNKKWRVENKIPANSSSFLHAFAFLDGSDFFLHIIASGTRRKPADEMQALVNINNRFVAPSTRQTFDDKFSARYVFSYTGILATSVVVDGVPASLLRAEEYALTGLVLRSTSTKIIKSLGSDLKDIRSITLAELESLGAIFSHFILCDIDLKYYYGKVSCTTSAGAETSRKFTANADQQPVTIQTSILLPAAWCSYILDAANRSARERNILWSAFVFIFNGRAPPGELDFPQGGTQWRNFLDAFSSDYVARSYTSQIQSVGELCALSQVHYSLTFTANDSIEKRESLRVHDGVRQHLVAPVLRSFGKMDFTCYSSKSAIVGLLFYASYALYELEVSDKKYTLFALVGFRSRLKAFETSKDDGTSVYGSNSRNLSPLAIQAFNETEDSDADTLTVSNLKIYGSKLTKTKIVGSDSWIYTNSNNILALLYQQDSDESHSFTLSYKTVDAPHHVVTIEMELKD